MAFISYGAFWLSLVFIWAMPAAGLPAADPISMGYYLAIWGLFSLAMFVATLSGKLIGKLVFGSLVILFFLLALASFTGSATLHAIAGYEGILCGGLALYEAAALIINDRFERAVLPV